MCKNMKINIDEIEENVNIYIIKGVVSKGENELKNKKGIKRQVSYIFFV